MLLLVIGLSAMAQQKIQLRSADKAECVSSDMTSLKASFTFSTIEAEDYKSDRGTFSWLSLPNTVLGGNVGEPQLPVINELIAVPFGATPRIEITSYSTTDYSLAEYGMKTLVPRQLPVRKNQNLEDVPFVMNEAAYQTRGLRSEPQAVVNVDGTMRGVRLGNMTIDPVSYDPVNNIIRVFNDIEVTVHFDGADVETTEDMLMKTFSPAFEPVYSQLFNNSTIRSAYTDHPDLYNTPVRILVICYSGFRGNEALNNWLQWKLQKGYAVDIYYTDETGGTTASAIASFIKTKYNASVAAGNAYTYLIVIGDTGQVPQYMTKNIDSDIGNCASDLGYASVNFSSSTSNYFPDMYYSRISVENTTHLTNYINKVLTYEKYEFPDGGNYLNNVILVGGYDATWTSRVAKPTINYATNYYFNSSNTTYGGFENGNIEATISTSSTAGYAGSATGTSTTMGNGVYTSINTGVGFLNYTAHGDKQEWYQPKLTAAQVANLTNTGKYFFGVGNCCLTGNFNNTTTTYSPGSAIGTNACFAETMIRVPNAGAIAYVGCSPYSYWYEDFYWAVGAHSYSQGNYPTTSASSTGVYDAMFDDANWNSASALLYLGNLAVQQAVTNSNTNSSVTDGNCNNSAHYYFQFYHTFGDGSIMPYVTKPEANTVTIPSTVTPGTSSITVNAVAGSYVAVTDNSSVIYGVGVANASGVATVNFTENIPGSGNLYVVVTRQQYQPYFGTIQIVGGTQYTITVTQPQHGTISAPAQAYANSTVTLTATPETGYCLSSWIVKKGNTNITVTDNQFTMPEGNVTVTATFVQGLEVTLADVQHGTISADPLYALQGTTINLTATPAAGYEFGSWVVYKTGDPNTTVTVTGNSFTMPNYPVTVSAGFVLGPTELTVNNGTATNQYIPMYGYYFDDYTKSECIIPASALTAMIGSTISAITFYPSSVATTNSTWTSTSQTVFLKEVSSTTLGGSFSGTSGATTVKQALLEMPTAGEPYTITFDAPYTYNGGNLLIGVYNTDDGSYNKVEWYGTSNLTSGVSAYGSNSSSLSSVSYNAQSFLPKTTFTYMPSSSYIITATANPTAGGSVNGVGSFEEGETCTLTATANTGYNFTNWTKNGNVVSTNATYTFTVTASGAYVANFDAIPQYTVSIAPDDVEKGSVSFGSRSNRDDLVYDFEDGTQGWTTLQGSTSTSPNNWHHNTTHVSYSSGTAHDWSSFGNNSSSGFMMSESYISATSSSGTAYGAVTPDNYLVSPQVRLGGNISFYAGARNTSYCAEKFSVMVSTTDNTNTASFTTVGTWTLSLSEAGYTSTPYTVDLSAYSGMGYIAIRHWDCYDQWVLCIDDITITQPEVNDGSESATFYEGESCTVVATPNTDYAFAEWTENGTTASSNASYSFTVTGDRYLVANFSQTPPCYAPTELAASDVDHQSTVLNWNGEADSWKVAYKLSTASQFTEVAVNTNSYTMTELLPETSYTVKVASICGDETVWCEPISFTTLPEPCNAPTDLAASDVDHQSAVLNWSGEADSWKVAYKLSTASQFTEIAVNTNSYTMTELLPETSYTVKVASICGDETVWCEPISFTTLPVPCPAPTDVMVTNVSRNSAVVSWTEAGDATSWVVAYRKDIAMNDPFTEVEVSEPTYTLSDLAEGTLYIIKVRPVCDDITDSWSDTEFTTESCYTISLNADEPSMTENFDTYTQSVTTSTGVEPTCWVLVQEDVTMPDNKKPQIYCKSSFAHSGNYSLVLNYRGIYAMPLLSEDVTIQNVKLEMYLRQANAAYQLQVGVWDDELGTFSPVAVFNNETTGVEFVACDFSGYTGNGRRIAFRNVLGGGANYNYSYNYIDDITLSLKGTEDCAITLPYNETFEGYTAETGATGVEPDCWNLVQEDVAMTDATVPQLFQKTTYAHSGNYSLRMYNRGIYAMPALSSDVDLNEVKLEMYVRQPNKCYQLQIGVWDEQTETFEPVALVNNSTTDITYFTCDFSGYEGNGHRIAFRNTLNGGANYNYSYNYIDDISLSVIEPSIGCDGRISMLPYEENFDSYTLVTTASTGVEPDCWELVREDVELTDATRPQLYCKSSFAHSGNYSLKMSYRCVYAMPVLPTDVNLNDLNLSMYLRQANAAYRLEVGVWDDQTQTFEAVQLFNNSTTNVEPVSCDFSGYTGNGRRIAFRNVLADGAHYDYSYNYLDDITLSYTNNARYAANENNFNSTGIGRLLESVTVYPNPTKDYVNVQCTMNDETLEVKGIEVIDMYGKVIYTVVGANNYSPLQTRINVSGLAAGMYFVRVTTDQGVVTKTFVKR